MKNRAPLSREQMLSTAIVLAKNLGLYIKRKKRPKIAYDGTYAYASKAEDAFHEIGHWIICDPHRRCVAGYGLGTDYLGEWCPRLVSLEEAEAEEREASALGIWMMWTVCKNLAIDCAAKESWTVNDEEMLLRDVSRAIKNKHKALVRATILKSPSLRMRMNVESVSSIN